MEASAWPVQDLFEGAPFDAPDAARPPNGATVGSGCGVGAVPELGGTLNPSGGLLFDLSPGSDALAHAKEPDDPARVIRNREVALRARRAAKEKMTALVEANGAMAARVESLVMDNEKLKREVAQLRARLA
ncbi:hypothetical protein I4F81_004784 [Pyropia yezoensis]|uniref:Uncharacterized protein n=1 Tax=Pyropia yezoensis TaxID=2788 RepID=A0ACC3BWX7_PYRYE|nr:hypothetical protein I4F81_004784 [Neopyropia yezoensis]